MSIVPKPLETAVLLPINDFRQFVPLSRSAIYGMIRKNKLRTVMVGGRRMVPKAEADRLASGVTLNEEGSPKAA